MHCSGDKALFIRFSPRRVGDPCTLVFTGKAKEVTKINILHNYSDNFIITGLFIMTAILFCHT